MPHILTKLTNPRGIFKEAVASTSFYYRQLSLSNLIYELRQYNRELLHILQLHKPSLLLPLYLSGTI